MPTANESHSGFSDVFAEFIGKLETGENKNILRETAFQLSENINSGHTRFRLSDDAATGGFPEIDDWVKILQQSALVSDGSEVTPLVLQQRNNSAYICLYRHYVAEKQLAHDIVNLAAQKSELPLPKEFVDFFPQYTKQPDWQAVAALCALKNKLCIITGGPGTGKTTTVAKIIKLLHLQNRECHIAIAAPTGKAAQRLEVSLHSEDINHPSHTLHRLLGITGGTARHNRDNPLPHNTIIVDEASMIDLELMGMLFAALKPGAQLILLGDENQLSSVEAGSVLYDICSVCPELSAEFSEEIYHTGIVCPDSSALKAQENNQLANCIVKLRHSWRFDPSRGIGQLSEAILKGYVTDNVLTSSPEAEFVIFTPSVVEEWLHEQILSMQQAADNLSALEVLAKQRILCATRQGPRGLSNIDATAQRIMQAKGIRSQNGYYHRQPLLIEENDYTNQLFNGETCLVDLRSSETPLAHTTDGRSLPLSQLPTHRPAWALTVHKSQGSEFDHVLFILPTAESFLCGKELAYTAVTRARNKIVITGESLEELQAAASITKTRNSGLADILKDIINQ